jgi:hypothetical protein
VESGSGAHEGEYEAVKRSSRITIRRGPWFLLESSCSIANKQPGVISQLIVLHTTTADAMVNFASAALAILALTPVIGAVALPDTTVAASSAGEVERFSFVKWVDDMIANPNGTHLSPEQAYEAWQTTVVNAPEPGRHTIHKEPLDICGTRC